MWIHSTMLGFIYLWRDKSRNMYYVGSHEGVPTDGYVSSSRWFNGEYHYRPHDFRRRILKVDDIDKIRQLELELLTRIKEAEYCTRYYNQKSGRPKGKPAWNAGKVMTDEYRKAIGEGRKGKGTGKPAWNRGMTGGRVELVDGKRTLIRDKV